ncbi:MAG: hypothetical protein Q8M44_00975 [bacterium]|nr:hypothetical protein [bacterium]
MIIDVYGFLSYQNQSTQFQSVIIAVQSVIVVSLFSIRLNQAHTVLTVIVNSQELNLVTPLFISHISNVQLLTIISGWSI